MNINDKLVFNYKFFEHAYEYKPDSKFLPLLIKLYKNKLFSLALLVIEKIFTFLLCLRIPIYSDLILAIVSSFPGLPRMFGCYLRALYYKGKLELLEPNVIIEQGATISNPQNVCLHEFSFIDKYVIIAANSAKIGRRVHIAPFVIVTGGGEFIAEDYAGIASGCKIITATESLKPGTRSSGPMVSKSQRDIIRGFVHIKKDAFIAVGVTILTNTTIEEGVVLAANVVVSGKTKEWNFYSIQDSQNKTIRSKTLRKRKKTELESN